MAVYCWVSDARIRNSYAIWHRLTEESNSIGLNDSNNKNVVTTQSVPNAVVVVVVEPHRQKTELKCKCMEEIKMCIENIIIHQVEIKFELEC